MKQRSALGWFTTPELLALVAVLAAAAWGAVSVVDGGSYVDLLPAVVTLLLVALALVIRRRGGLDADAPVVPPWFVPAALAVAAIVAAVVGAAAAVSALVMASPAAAIFGVHAAFGAGASRARKAGVRLNGLATLDAATHVDTLVLDKNGTVTTGDLTVVSVDPFDPDHDRNLRWFAGALEKASEHPVGQAIATLSARGRLAEVEVLPGQGIRGTVDRHPVRVGSPEWMGFEPAPTMWTTVGVEVDGRALGSITVADDVRPDVARDITRLSELGLQLVLVSDDTLARTSHLAGLAGIETFHAPCVAADVVRDLEAEGRLVGTVGVVAGGSLGISADDGATIVVDDCSPRRVADALTIARRTAGRVKRVSLVTLALGIVGVAIGATGLVPPAFGAGFAVAASAVTAWFATSG